MWRCRPRTCHLSRAGDGRAGAHVRHDGGGADDVRVRDGALGLGANGAAVLAGRHVAHVLGLGCRARMHSQSRSHSHSQSQGSHKPCHSHSQKPKRKHMHASMSMSTSTSTSIGTAQGCNILTDAGMGDPLRHTHVCFNP